MKRYRFLKKHINCLIGLFAFTFSGSILAASCTDIGSLTINNVRITETEAKQPGDFTPGQGPIISLPAHCRVAMVLSPSDDSQIEMEIWMPEPWNGKFLALGNGGWAGSISFSAMAIGLQSGYAVASNDTGHTGGRAAFAINHPERVVDFGYRAMHEMAIQSKAIIESYYSRSPDLSYFQGCSTGGRQGLMEAQRYPADFDAIIAGAPVNNQLALNGTQLHNMQTIIQDQSLYLPPAKIQMVHNAVLAVCEANDGVADGFFNNPLACNFEPTTLLCSDAETASCLTPDQLKSVQNVFGGVSGSDGEEIYPGHAIGFELGWRMPTADSTPSVLQSDAFAYVAHEDPDWSWQEFDLESDLALARDKAGFIEALDMDLSEFKERGGKLLLYHGWNDPGPSPLNTINYYSGVLQTLDGEQSDWMRLFMMPGMGHCRGGIGPDQADFLGALDRWRDADIAPAQITASRIRAGRVDMTRPLCAFPAVASWDGEGNPNDAANYSCSIP